jgi:hypothetical protein
MRPLASIRQDRVDVTEIAVRGVGRIPIEALQARHEVRSVRGRAEQLTLEANLRKYRPQVLDSRSLLAGGVDRVEADQAPEELGGLSRKLPARWGWPCAGGGARLRGEPAGICEVSCSSHAFDATPPGKPGTLGQAASNSRV